MRLSGLFLVTAITVSLVSGKTGGHGKVKINVQLDGPIMATSDQVRMSLMMMGFDRSTISRVDVQGSSFSCSCSEGLAMKLASTGQIKIGGKAFRVMSVKGSGRNSINYSAMFGSQAGAQVGMGGSMGAKMGASGGAAGGMSGSGGAGGAGSGSGMGMSGNGQGGMGMEGSGGMSMSGVGGVGMRRRARVRGGNAMMTFTLNSGGRIAYSTKEVKAGLVQMALMNGFSARSVGQVSIIGGTAIRCECSSGLMMAIKRAGKIQWSGGSISISGISGGASADVKGGARVRGGVKAGGKAVVLHNLEIKLNSPISVSSGNIKSNIIDMGKANGLKIQSSEIGSLTVSGSTIKCSCSNKIYNLIKAQKTIKVSRTRSVEVKSVEKKGKSKGSGSKEKSGSKGKSGSKEKSGGKGKGGGKSG